MQRAVRSLAEVKKCGAEHTTAWHMRKHTSAEEGNGGKRTCNNMLEYVSVQ